MDIKVITITPEGAAAYLQKNPTNRPLKPVVVKRYAAAMKRGEWDGLNGETIKLNGDGTLVDGQHRLAAVVESGLTLTTTIVMGVRRTAQDTIDTGTRRTLSDALKIRGEANHTTLAGALGYAYRHFSRLEGQRIYPTTTQALTLLDEHPGIRVGTAAARRLHRHIHFNPSLAAWLYYHFGTIDRDDAEDFFTRLVTLEKVDAGHPILTLNQTVLRDAASSPRMSVIKVQAITIKAWNAYRDGRELRLLKWSPGGSSPESFPHAR